MCAVPLPPALRRWWPLFKRLHRALTRISGAFNRFLALFLSGRGVPRGVSERSVDTARLEQQHVVVHPAGPAELVRRTPVTGVPPHHWVFEEEPTASVPPGFVLDVTDGRLAGDFGAVVTPGNRLDHETSRYFGTWDWREHPVYLRPTLGEVERVEGTVLSLANRGTSGNYYHFLYDAIGRYGLFEAAMEGTRLDAVIVPHRSGYQRQLLELAGIPGPYLQPERGKVFQADRLLVPNNPNWALQAPPQMVDWLRKRLVPRNPPADPVRLFLTRGTTPTTRIYVEEAELMAVLEPRGFRRLDPGTLSVQEQIDVFSKAEIIVAPHGAGLTNVTFSPPDVKVLEMFPSTYVHRGLYAICQAIGADYRYLVADGRGGPDGPNAGIADDVSIPVERVVAQVDELLASR
jgi:capsular polysaccharide biosynthesis protein